MANEIRVNTTRLGSDADNVARLIASMEKELSSMQHNIAAMNKMWKGPAKQAFQAAFENDRQAAVDVLRELKSLQTFETQAKKKYEKCEQQVASLVNSISV